ncbi:MAG: tetratricopeptide repeat-containing sensor histidine kinase [Chryseolinea sp.]
MLFRVVVLVIFLQVHFVCCAQINEIDSLENIVKTIPADTAKVWHLNKLVTVLREKDNIKAMIYGEQARELALLLNYKPGLATALENVGWLHYRKGDYSTSLALSLEALTMSEELNDQSGIARCLNSIAAINIEQSQHALGISNFKRAYAISDRIGDKSAMARALCNISFCYLGLKEMDSAKLYANRGLRLSRQFNKPYMVGFALRTLGDVDVNDQNYKEALVKFDRAFVISDSLQNVFLKVSTVHRIGKTYFLLKQYDRAASYLLMNLENARKHQFKSELERTLKLLSEVYNAKSDLGKAFQYQTEYLIVHDSLYQQRSNEQMALMQVRFDSEMQEAKIKLLTQDAQINQEEINSQRLWMYFSAGCLSLMAILAFVLFYNNTLKKRANDELEVKNEEIQQQAFQLRNLNVTKDKLFSIISHDLRSPLASLRGLMDIMGMEGITQDEFVTSSKTLKRNLESVQEDLDNLLAWAQSQLNGLQSNPTNLKIKPIIDEKIHLFGEIARLKEITVVNEVDHSTSVVADRDHIGLVIRNLIANAIKFNTPGGIIRITEKAAGNFIEISVSDSGVGMTTNDLRRLFNAGTHFTQPGTQQEKGVGIGLLLTKEFVEKNGGSIRAISEFGKGSTFTFTVKQNPVIVTS